jgi:hypothetical protein
LPFAENGFCLCDGIFVGCLPLIPCLAAFNYLFALNLSRTGRLIVEAWLIPVSIKIAAVKAEISAVLVLLGAAVAAAVEEDHG